LGSSLIITGTKASCILSEKELDMIGSSMDIWKTGWTKWIDSRRWRVNDSILG